MKKIINKKLLMLFIALGMLSVCAINAQEGEVSTTAVSGMLVDESERPLANVVLFNSVDETVSGADGSFTINVPVTGSDHIVIDEDGFRSKIILVNNGTIQDEKIVLQRKRSIDGSRTITLPYQNLVSDRSVSATSVISGEELASYPAITALEALSGRIPGLVIHKYNSQPGHETVGASVRGISAVIYIDGILRDPSDLSVHEIDQVEVIKDFSGRSMLGIAASNPVIWITTKTGGTYKTDVRASFDMGYSSPTILPDYLDSYNYASLLNEAMANDGLSPVFSEEEIAGYQSGENLLRYPDIDYYGEYVRSSTPLRRANINAGGGDDIVKYFSMLDYVGSGGLEAIGENSRSDRYKLRGNVDLQLTDFLSMNVNLSGTYGDSRFPNQGGGASPYNIFGGVLSHYPSNAHAMEYDGMLLQSPDYPTNLTNVLMYNGFAERVDLNTQNSVGLVLDLNESVEGLSAHGRASFDVNNVITNNKGGTEALYRHSVVADEDMFERIVERQVVTTMGSGYDFYLRRTTFNLGMDYDRTFGNHEITGNVSYLQLLEEIKVQTQDYQPRKLQDISLRANYAFDRRYILQMDLNYSGSMKLPEGERFNLFPTVGAAWVASNEGFLENSNLLSYLKFYTSAGIMGVDNFYTPGYNQYYLHRSLWQGAGGWRSGISGEYGPWENIYEILQAGSNDFTIPKRNYLNIGVQSIMFGNSLSAEVNYFYQKNYDQISPMVSRTPSLFGTGGFLSVTNFGENEQWGFDGLLELSQVAGDFSYSFGVNALYAIGRYLVVDEPIALEEHRKRAGKETDLIWGYETNGLYQSQEDIDNYGISTPWGTAKPGDIKYVDYTGNGMVDERDVHTTGAHYPRIHYGLHLSLGYRGLNLFVAGKGVADGEVMLTHPNYFWVNSSSRNFSEPMLDRWPETNDYPRLTASSPHSYQPSNFWLRNAAYFSLSNVELSYKIPRSAIQSISMRDITIFARGKNLLYVSELTDYGINPENMNAGISYYPLLQSVTFGLSAKF